MSAESRNDAFWLYMAAIPPPYRKNWRYFARAFLKKWNTRKGEPK